MAERERERERGGLGEEGRERRERRERESQSHFTLALTHDPTHTCDTPYPDAMSCDGLSDVQNSDQSLNVVSFVWSPLRPATLSFKVNCLSTEFAARKHGGWREREIREGGGGKRDRAAFTLSLILLLFDLTQVGRRGPSFG